MLRAYIAATIMVLSIGSAGAAASKAPPINHPTQEPTDVRITSVPAPPQPVQVSVTSLPTAAPTDVRIVSEPPDDSAHNLVIGTWWLVVATAGTCLVAGGSVAWQSRETKKRDIAAMRRELNRNAYKLSATAERIRQIAEEIPVAATSFYVQTGHTGLPADLQAKIEEASENRNKRLQEITNESTATLLGIDEMTAVTLDRNLKKLDGFEVQMAEIRDAVTSELNDYRSRADKARAHNTTMQAAALSAQMSRNTR